MVTRKRFDHYQFSLFIIKQTEDGEIREMFRRLQNGKPLNCQFAACPVPGLSRALR